MISFSVSRIAASISAGHLCLSDLSSCSAIALARCFGFMSITITWGIKRKAPDRSEARDHSAPLHFDGGLRMWALCSAFGSPADQLAR